MQVQMEKNALTPNRPEEADDHHHQSAHVHSRSRKTSGEQNSRNKNGHHQRKQAVAKCTHWLEKWPVWGKHSDKYYRQLSGAQSM